MLSFLILIYLPEVITLSSAVPDPSGFLAVSVAGGRRGGPSLRLALALSAPTVWPSTQSPAAQIQTGFYAGAGIPFGLQPFPATVGPLLRICSDYLLRLSLPRGFPSSLVAATFS